MLIAYSIIFKAIVLLVSIFVFTSMLSMFKKNLANSYGFYVFRLVIWSIIYILLIAKAILSILLGFSFIEILLSDIYCLVISTIMIYKNYKLVLESQSKRKNNNKNISSDTENSQQKNK